MLASLMAAIVIGGFVGYLFGAAATVAGIVAEREKSAPIIAASLCQAQVALDALKILEATRAQTTVAPMSATRH